MSPAPTTPTEADLPPGSLPPGSTVIPNIEAMSDPTIDTFIAEVGEMKKEGELVRSSAAQGETKAAKSNNQPMTTETIKEKIMKGEIIRSEIL